MTADQVLRFVIKPVVFIACLLPLVTLVYDAVNDLLGPNPIEALLRGSGDWVLRFLLVTLTLTPLRRLTGWTGWIRLRRMLGLYTFFYACLHFTIYICFLSVSPFLSLTSSMFNVEERCTMRVLRIQRNLRSMVSLPRNLTKVKSLRKMLTMYPCIPKFCDCLCVCVL